MTDFIPYLLFWHWFIAGVLLMAIELFVPGSFFLWIGVAAFGVGLIVSVFPIESTTQLLIFAITSPIVMIIGRRCIYSQGALSSDKPSLNRRDQQLVGTTIILSHPIENGTAHIKVGDSMWKVEGPDLPARSPVQIIELKGNTLIVKPL